MQSCSYKIIALGCEVYLKNRTHASRSNPLIPIIFIVIARIPVSGISIDLRYNNTIGFEPYILE